MNGSGRIMSLAEARVDFHRKDSDRFPERVDVGVEDLGVGGAGVGVEGGAGEQDVDALVDAHGRERIRGRLIAVVMFALIAAVALILAPTAAHATAVPTSYVLVAWEVGNPENVWESPQKYVTSAMLDTPTLDALDGMLPCGTFLQVDLYVANNDSAALIAGGVLYGPNNPTEPLAHGAVDGDPWKYVQTAECAVKPDPRPFHDERTTSDCEWTTTYTRDGFFDLDFDPVANVWTERPEPTITAEASSQAPVTAAEKAVACAPGEQLPTLAETGLSPAASWLGVGAVFAVFAGWVLRRVGRVRRAAHRR